MNPEQLHHMRHSLAHLFRSCDTRIIPGSKLTIGPSVDNGFYYDLDCTTKISDQDLPTIEEKCGHFSPLGQGLKNVLYQQMKHEHTLLAMNTNSNLLMR